MDFCQNVTISSALECHQQHPQLLASTCSLDDLFPAQNTDVVDEWLSVYVENCFSSAGNSIQAEPTISTQHAMQNAKTTPKPLQQQKKPQLKKAASSLEKFFVVPGKARSKRKRVSIVSTGNPLISWSSTYGHQNIHLASSDPPLLQQTHWLADSELINPIKQDTTTSPKLGGLKEVKIKNINVQVQDQEKAIASVVGKGANLGILENSGGQQQQQPRRCTHCLSQRTPQWRAGPLGPKTLCNACGVRYKSGRLLPEYRPAKSPTFVTHLHSNSHKKVMEMRMHATSSSVFH